MPVVETKIGQQLRALIRLQHIDTLIDQVIKERGDLPEEIRDLEDETAGLTRRIEKIQLEQHEVEIRRNRGRLDIQEAEQLIKKYEDQQLLVRNNREYDALTKEIESQQERILEARNFIDSTENRIADDQVIIDEAQARLEEVRNVLAEKQEQLLAVLETTDQKQADLEQRRQDAAGSVDSRYLRAYSRLRKRLRDGRAVVMLQRGAASGFAVPPQRQVEIRQGNRIVACEHTGRIIVDSDLYAETTKDITY
ncbi:MAG: hypothetical protein OXM02_09355 [Bacteroidota bacterium]|nr:hypothetical protein [Bacteroidota bacterium]MDE2834709.1 hypothetical protein [Bacteroidota bacterium]MDE2956653.1 hypothetical protein [Bacteroidota bacterium]